MKFSLYNICFTFVLILSVNTLLNAQTTRFVPSQYSSVNAAITASSDGDIIDITGAISTYQIAVNKNLILMGHGTTKTIITGISSLSSVFSINNGKTVTMKNMTIRNGSIGIMVYYASLNIINCNICYNSVRGIYNQSKSGSGSVTISYSSINHNGNNGGTLSNGIGIYNGNYGVMTISNSSIDHNFSMNVSNIRGAGIYNSTYANLTINYCDISYNSLNSKDSIEGGGIYNDRYATLTINNSNVNNNYLATQSSYASGAGIYNNMFAVLNVYNSKINNNHDSASYTVFGGGIFNNRYANLTIDNSSVNYNTLTAIGGGFGGGVYNELSGTVSVSNSSVSNNSISGNAGDVAGGGIFNQSELNIYGSTINGNVLLQGWKGCGGGICHLWGNLSIFNSTISYNSIPLSGSNRQGGGIFNGSYLKLNNSTISNNMINGGNGSGIWCEGTTRIKNCIVAGNFKNTNRTGDCFGSDFISYGHNLIGQANLNVYTEPGDTAGLNPFLDTLKNNGGPTFTQALLDSSYAINHGDSLDMDNNRIIRDQRGFRRVSPMDIGAYDKDGYLINILQITDDICDIQQNIPIIKIELYFPENKDITEFSFISKYTTLISEITKAKLFFTDSVNQFSAIHQFGSALISPNDSFVISGYQNIHPGYNYFWLTYDIAGNTAAGHIFDATCFKLILNSKADSALVTSPFGNRTFLPVKADFIINDSIQCLGINNFFLINNSITKSADNSFTWLFGDSCLSFNSDSVFHQYIDTGSFTISLIAETESGCRDSISKRVYVNPSPVSDFYINDSIQCLQGNKFIFTNHTQLLKNKNLSFLWHLGDGNTDTSTNSSHSYLSSDTFSVKLISITNNGCTDYKIKELIISAQPNAEFTINDSVQCLNDNYFFFSNHSTISSGNLDYKWDIGKKAVSSNTDTSYRFDKIGEYYIGLIATSETGCADTNNKKIYVNLNPVASFNVNDSFQCLHANSFNYTNQSMMLNDTFYSLWDYGDSIYTSKWFSPIHVYTDTGNYKVKLIVMSREGCKDSMIKGVSVYPDPILTFPSDEFLCDSGSVELVATILNGEAFWYIDSLLNIPFMKGSVYNTPVLYKNTKYFIVARNTGCVLIPKKPVNVFVTPTPNIISTYPASLKGGGSVILKASASSGDVNWYDDSIGGYLLSTDTFFITPILNKTTTYYVDATNNNCTTNHRIGITAAILPNSIADYINADGIYIFPNPAESKINITFPPLKGMLKLRLLNNTGIEVLSKNISSNAFQNSYSLDLTGLSSGIYVLIISDVKNVWMGKFVKE